MANCLAKLLAFRYNIGPIMKFTALKNINEVQEINTIIIVPVCKGIDRIQGSINEKKITIAAKGVAFGYVKLVREGYKSEKKCLGGGKAEVL